MGGWRLKRAQRLVAQQNSEESLSGTSGSSVSFESGRTPSPPTSCLPRWRKAQRPSPQEAKRVASDLLKLQTSEGSLTMSETSSMSLESERTPSPPVSCFARCRKPRRQEAKKVASEIIKMQKQAQSFLPPMKKASFLDQPRSHKASSDILAELQAESLIPGARDLHRADLCMTANANFTRGGVQWEVEDPTRPPTRAGVTRALSRAASRSASRSASRVDYRLTMEHKERRSRKLRDEQEAERQEHFRQRRQRVAESRERARKNRARLAEEKRERAQAAAANRNDRGPQNNPNLPPLPSIADLDMDTGSDTGRYWALMRGDMLDLL